MTEIISKIKSRCTQCGRTLCAKKIKNNRSELWVQIKEPTCKKCGNNIFNFLYDIE